MRNRGKSLFIVNIRHVQLTLMFFGLQHYDTVDCEQILAPSGVTASSLLLFWEDIIQLTMGVDLIRDYSSEESANSRKTSYGSKV